MKQIILAASIAIVFGPMVISGQVPIPAPVADREMRDTSSIRRRSLELERVKREANAPAAADGSDWREINFAEVKEDFEGIQKAQTSIVKAYTTGKAIDYRKIGRLSIEINKSSRRLASNLFVQAAAVDPEAGKPEKAETNKRDSFEEIIVDLDTRIGSFSTSGMFRNLRVVDPAISEKARSDLERIIELSSLLNQQADQLARSGRQ